MEIISSDQPDFEIRKNNLFPPFWNLFQRINTTNITEKEIIAELDQLLEIVSTIVAERNLQYFIMTTNNISAKRIFEKKLLEMFTVQKTDNSSNRVSSEKQNEIRAGYSSSDPFLNYRKLKWALDAYFKNVELHIDNARRINEFSRKLSYEDDIYGITHRALIEIQDLVLIPNNNADRLLKEAFDESNRLINNAQNIINKNNDIFTDLYTYQTFYNIRQLIIDFNWDIKILMSSSHTLGEPYVDEISSEAISRGLRPPMFEYYSFINNRKQEKKEKANKDISQASDTVLSFDEYFQIILVIYNQPRRTVRTYLADKYKEVVSKNPDFLKYLYKYINTVLIGVHKEGDLDIFIENSDLEFGHDDIKVVGSPTSLDEALTWLWMELLKGYVEKDPINGLPQLKRFETLFLTENDNAPPAFTQNIAELNKELRIITGNTITSNYVPEQEVRILRKPLNIAPSFKAEAFKRLDYKNTSGYMLSDKLEEFKQIEHELLKRKFLDDNGRWIEAKNKLCAFIHLLHGKYLRSNLPKKGSWTSLLDYRRYFEARYCIDISKSFQKNQFPPGNAKDFIPDFKFIIPAGDLN